jgi:hypothetical protein
MNITGLVIADNSLIGTTFLGFPCHFSEHGDIEDKHLVQTLSEPMYDSKVYNIEGILYITAVSRVSKSVFKYKVIR